MFDQMKQNQDSIGSNRSRSMSVTTDSSVASILSNSDRLIPEAFLPVDIQVLSRGRPRSNGPRYHSDRGVATPSRFNGSAPLTMNAGPYSGPALYQPRMDAPASSYGGHSNADFNLSTREVLVG